jgi:ketosteroid isomerase-like protein
MVAARRLDRLDLATVNPLLQRGIAHAKFVRGLSQVEKFHISHFTSMRPADLVADPIRHNDAFGRAMRSEQLPEEWPGFRIGARVAQAGDTMTSSESDEWLFSALNERIAWFRAARKRRFRLKQQTLLVIALVIAVMPVSEATPPRPQDQHSLESEIRAADTSRFRALTEGDLPALERALSDDLVYTHSNGWRQTKAELLASLRSGELVYHSFTSDNVKIQVLGTAVVVTGHAAIKARTKGQELNVSSLYLEVYVKRDGRWQLAAWQSTRLGP